MDSEFWLKKKKEGFFCQRIKLIIYCQNGFVLELIHWSFDFASLFPPASVLSLTEEIVAVESELSNNNNNNNNNNNILLKKLEFLGFPPLRKGVSPHERNHDNLSRVFAIANQLLVRHLLYLAP